MPSELNLYPKIAGYCVLVGALSVCGVRGEPLSVAARIDGDAVVVEVAGKLFTQYKFGRDQKKPYLWPLAGPTTGKSVTTETSEPYPHHNSMWFGCDHLNGRDYWHHQNPNGAIFSRGPVLEAAKGEKVVFSDTCEWTPRDGKTLASPTMLDIRRITIQAPDAKTRLIDFQIAWVPLVDVTITKTNHSLFALRMHPDLSVQSGGTMINAEGARQQGGTLGKPSAWIDYHGTRDGKTEGAAILGHPSNRWYPSPWLTRDYGFFSPTPMQWLKRPLLLPKGQPVVLAYRVVVHSGTHEEAGIAAHATAFAKEPAPAAPDVSKMLQASFQRSVERACGYHFGETRRDLAQIQTAVASASAGDEEQRRPVSTALAGALNQETTTPSARRFLCRQLGLLGGEGAVPALAGQLGAEDENTAETAVLALGCIGTPEAVAALEMALPKLPARIQATAASALGSMGEAGVTALADRVSGADPVCVAGAKALGHAGTDQAVKVLLGALQAAPPEQRRLLQDALLKTLGRKNARVSPEPAADACRRLAATELGAARQTALLAAAIRFLPVSESRSLLMRALSSEDQAVREGAVQLGVRAADAELSRAVCGRFDALTETEQIVLLQALKERGDAAFAGVPRQAVGAKAAPVHAAACSALGVLGNSEDVPKLLAAIGLGDGVGEAARRALTRIPGAGVAALIGDALVSTDSANRREILDLLIDRAEAGSVHHYMSVVRDKDRRVREAALRGVGKHGTPAELTELVALLNDEIGDASFRRPFESCTAALCRTFADAGPASAPCLAALPKATVPGRPSILRVLGILAEAEGLAAIVGDTKSPDEGTRDAAVRALATWPDATAWDSLLTVARDTENLIHHVLAVRGCRRLLGTMADADPEDLKVLYDAALAVARREDEKKLFVFSLEGVSIRDLKVKSKRPYRVRRGGMRKGATWTTDRKYTFSKVPAELVGATYIQTAMDDKAASNKADFLSFRIEEPVVVYVGFDSRCRKLPKWLAAWEKTALVVREETNSCRLPLYRKAFPVGKVVVGGNKALGVGAIFTVVVVPGGGGQ
ncbi:MAG: hypothetical protein HN742_00425 [Lentisphaerae bacterium]|nr:hypothetical protein [Lentisphaerota bacterium]MBT4820668.1 hypothetical protein [Lentisphaerota bacterium]MBT5608809.1 hypothetical protein [Lentisphaerota bacterium]MBT7840295.1 hypothetical protein [Lentisphaerota bacterium]